MEIGVGLIDWLVGCYGWWAISYEPVVTQHGIRNSGTVTPKFVQIRLSAVRFTVKRTCDHELQKAFIVIMYIFSFTLITAGFIPRKDGLYAELEVIKEAIRIVARVVPKLGGGCRTVQQGLPKLERAIRREPALCSFLSTQANYILIQIIFGPTLSDLILSLAIYQFSGKASATSE